MSTRESRQDSDIRVDRVRRALLRAGWMVPIVLSLKIPLDALAQYKLAEPPPEEKK